MSKEYEKMSSWEILSRSLFKKFDELKMEFRGNIMPEMKRIIKLAFLWTLIIFVGSLVLVILGTELEKNSLVVYGKIGLIFSSLIFLVLATPIGFVFAGKKYTIFVTSFAVFQLFSTLVIWLTPMPVNLNVLFALTMSGFLLAMINSLATEMKAIRLATTVIFCAILASLYFPTTRAHFERLIEEVNEPKLLQINKGDIPSGKVRFYLQGQPAVWYFVTPEGKYELFDNKGHHDIYKDRLLPITETVINRLIANENLLSVRNMHRDWASSQMTPEPKSEPLPVPPAPDPAPVPAPIPPPDQLAPPIINPKPIPTPPAPVEQPDNRKLYAVVVVDKNYNEDSAVGRKIVEWLKTDRALYAYDYARVEIGVNDLTTNAREQLAKKAKNIFFARHRTILEDDNGVIKRCRSFVTVKIINADNGQKIQEIRKSQLGESIDTKDASSIALDFALLALKNEIDSKKL